MIERNYDMPPGSGPDNFRPYAALVVAAAHSIPLAIIPLEEPTENDERVAIFPVTSTKVVEDDPVLRELILEYARDGEEKNPGSLAVAVSISAHKFLEKFLEDSDGD